MGDVVESWTAPDPLRVQFFAALGLGAVIVMALLGSAISTALTCASERPDPALTTERTPNL